MQKTVKKVRINFKALIFLLLVIYLIGMLLYTFFTIRVQNIYINNTHLLTDNEIIEKAELKDYPILFKVNPRKIENNLAQLELVSDVKVKKTLLGKVIIDITEAKPLFYERSSNKIILSNKKSVDTKDIYLGIPILVNFVPKDLLNDFIEAFNKVNPDIIGMINEIEYNPDINEDVVIDNERFKLRMNDQNIVYINTLNMNRLNNYIEIYASIASAVDNKKGTLYLDSYLSENNLFTPFGNNGGVNVGDTDNGE